MDDLVWLFGPPGAGKGTLLEALRQAFGQYGRGVPANELIKGARHASHSAWVARLAGARVLFSDDVPTGHQLEDTVITMLLGRLAPPVAPPVPCSSPWLSSVRNSINLVEPESPTLAAGR